MKPILRDFPDEIQTERLIIRCPRAGDGAALNAAVLESLDDLRPWMPWAKDAPTLDDSEEYCRRSLAKWITREELTLLLFLKDGMLVGGSGLHSVRWNVPKFEIGYWLRVSQQGKGLMTEALRAITAFTFEQFDAQRVEIRCDARNTKSVAVAQRAGFELEARLRNNVRGDGGELFDSLIYSRLPEQAT